MRLTAALAFQCLLPLGLTQLTFVGQQNEFSHCVVGKIKIDLLLKLFNQLSRTQCDLQYGNGIFLGPCTSALCKKFNTPAKHRKISKYADVDCGIKPEQQ